MTKDEFGFTFEKEDNIILNSDKSHLILNQVVPFLEKLKGNKDCDVIKWPGENRHRQIDEFLATLKRLGNDT